MGLLITIVGIVIFSLNPSINNNINNENYEFHQEIELGDQNINVLKNLDDKSISI